MARIKGAMMTRKRRKKTLKLAKGYFGAKSKLFRTAKEAVMKSGSMPTSAAARGSAIFVACGSRAFPPLPSSTA